MIRSLTDLPLAGAARLSATFPYVSPMPRVDHGILSNAYHFGDGGYYDNDGTSSVIEFLYYAYLQASTDPTKNTAPERPQDGPDNIILIEIRDGPNPDSNSSPDSAANQDNFGKSWGPGDQLFGPLKNLLQRGSRQRHPTQPARALSFRNSLERYWKRNLRSIREILNLCN
jgi:hypothetical protein